jgi:hypothetical protein
MERELGSLLQQLRDRDANTLRAAVYDRFDDLERHSTDVRNMTQKARSSRPRKTTRPIDMAAVQAGTLPLSSKRQLYKNNRATAMMKDHHVWLQDFRQRMGLERTGAGFRT